MLSADATAVPKFALDAVSAKFRLIMEIDQTGRFSIPLKFCCRSCLEPTATSLEKPLCYSFHETQHNLSMQEWILNLVLCRQKPIEAWHGQNVFCPAADVFHDILGLIWLYMLLY